MPSSRLVVNADLGQFNAAYQAGRHVARSADGTWFYSFQDGVNGRVVWQSHNGLVEIPLSPQPTMRPTFYADPSGLYCAAGFDGDKKHLLIWYIEDYKSVFTSGAVDPRVGGLVAQLAAQAQQIAAIEAKLTQAGSGSGASLSARYTQALERLCAFFGL